MKRTDALVPISDILELLQRIVYVEEVTVKQLLSKIEHDIMSTSKPIDNLKALHYFLLHKSSCNSTSDIYVSVLKTSIKLLQYVTDKEVLHVSLLGSILETCLLCIEPDQTNDIFLYLVDFIDLKFTTFNNSSNSSEEIKYCLVHSLVVLDKLCNFVISNCSHDKNSIMNQFPESLKANMIMLIYNLPLEISRSNLVSILPKFILTQCNNQYLKVIWRQLGKQNVELDKQLFYLCLLSDYFIVLTETSTTYPLYNSASFWEILQAGLIHENSLNRKQSLYLLKRYISVLQESDLSFETELFLWKVEEKEKLIEFWNSIFVLYETLEEKQIHLIMPAIKSVPQIYSLCKMNERILYSWLFCSFVRIFCHSSNLLVKWGLQEMCSLNSNLLFNDRKHSLLLSSFFKSLNNMLLFTSYNSSSSEADLESGLVKWFISISENESNTLAFEIMLENLTNSPWSPIPLFFVIDSLSKVPNKFLWNAKCFGFIKKMLIETLKTQCIFIRSAIQGRLLKCITQLSAADIGISLIVDILGHFNGQESLCRGSGVWSNCVEWIKRIFDSESRLELLNLCTNRIFSAEISNISIHSLARSIVLFSDAGIWNVNHDNILFKNIFEQFNECEKRAYSCRKIQDNCTEFLKFLLIEYSNGMTSENDIISLFKFNFKHLLQYIEMNLKRGTVNTIETLQLYESTLESITLHPSLLNNLNCEYIRIIEVSFNILNSENATFFQEYMSLKSILIYFNYISIQKFDRAKLFRSYELNILEYIFKQRLFNKISIKTFWSPSSEQNLKGKLMSEIMKTLWSILNLYLDYNSGSINLLLEIIPISSLCDSAHKAVSEDGKQAIIPLLKSFILILPYNNDVDFNTNFIRTSWLACFELRKSDLFWPAITNWISMVYQEKFTTNKQYHKLLFHYSKEIMTLGNELIGLVNVFMDHIKKCSVILEFTNTVSDGLTFGLIARKDRRIEYDVCQYILRQIEQGNIESFGTWKSLRNDKEVRLKALEVLLTPQKRQFEVIATVIYNLLDFDLTLTTNNKRYFNDSVIHRQKHRILQALLILETFIFNNQSPEFNGISEKLFDWSFESLQGTNQQPSVRYQLEWLFVRLSVHYPIKLKMFWELFEKAGSKRLGSMCSFISIAYHLSAISNDDLFLEKCFENIIPWCMSQNFNIRLYSQVVLSKLWDLNNNISDRYDCIRRNQWKINDQGNIMTNAKKMQSDFYFSVFHPLNHFNLQTIYWDLPRLSNISSEEWISPDILKKYSQLLSFESDGITPSLEVCSSPTWVSRVSGDANGEIDSNSIQKKFVPWKGMFTNPEESTIRSKSGIILVASLIDKAANLGGLARTCEIFAVKEFVVPNLEMVKEKEFTGLSMTAEKHLHITEVKPYNMQEYLKIMKEMGYLLIGAEQTTGSVSLANYELGHDCVLVLGNEREGIPANLIPLLDFCVEIPQLGVIRSLNVHVSGALFLWEYSKQHSLRAMP